MSFSATNPFLAMLAAVDDAAVQTAEAAAAADVSAARPNDVNVRRHTLCGRKIFKNFYGLYAPCKIA
jgi:hypothetical protein